MLTTAEKAEKSTASTANFQAIVSIHLKWGQHLHEFVIQRKPDGHCLGLFFINTFFSQ
jgi:hypothetical protein